jgi:hypothetical protein
VKSRAILMTAPDMLVKAFEEYTNINNFMFKEECISSNLLMTALIEKLVGRPIKYYKNLFYTRKLFEILKLSPSHEGMSEISYVLNMICPEAFQIVFSKKIASFIKAHSKSEILREVYLDVEMESLGLIKKENKNFATEIYKSLILKSS